MGKAFGINDGHMKLSNSTIFAVLAVDLGNNLGGGMR